MADGIIHRSFALADCRDHPLVAAEMGMRRTVSRTGCGKPPISEGSVAACLTRAVFMVPVLLKVPWAKLNGAVAPASRIVSGYIHCTGIVTTLLLTFA